MFFSRLVSSTILAGLIAASPADAAGPDNSPDSACALAKEAPAEAVFSLPFRTIVAVNKGKSGNMIRVVAEADAAEDDDDAEQSQYIFTEFDDAEAVDSALGLLEQMCEEAQEEGEGAS